MFKTILQSIFNVFSPFPKGLSLLLLAWVLIPSTPTQAGGKTTYKQKTYVNFEEALVEGKSRSPYSSYLFKKKEAAINDLSQWKPDWRNSVHTSRTRLK